MVDLLSLTLRSESVSESLQTMQYKIEMCFRNIYGTEVRESSSAVFASVFGINACRRPLV
jgi:hypothetical protein